MPPCILVVKILPPLPLTATRPALEFVEMAYFRKEVGAELALEPFVAKRRHSAYRDVDFDYSNEEDSTYGAMLKASTSATSVSR